MARRGTDTPYLIGLDLGLLTEIEVTIAIADFFFCVTFFIAFLFKFTNCVFNLAQLKAFFVLLQSIVEYHFTPHLSKQLYQSSVGLFGRQSFNSRVVAEISVSFPI